MAAAAPPIDADRYLAIERVLVGALIVAHLVGAAIAALLLTLVLPRPDDAQQAFSVATAVALPIYLGVIVPFSVVRGRRWAAPLRADLRAGVLTPLGRERLLTLPTRLIGLYAAGWAGGALLFGALDVASSPLQGVRVGLTVALSGASTSAIAYLVADAILRPFVHLALEGEPAERRSPGVMVRFVLAWLLGAGIPLAGVVLSAGLALITDTSAERVAVTAIVLGAIGLVVGFVAAVATARSVSRPLRHVRLVLAAVGEGDLSVAVPVDDASEVGELQAGVNAMVDGLREREHLRDLFGRHVGAPVAEQAAREGIALVGEERVAGVLFVDVIGSTGLAATRPPAAVVELLNRFFAVVVAVAAAHGGWVNKFAGDGALCVFGAPGAIDDPAGAALRAGRDLAQRLADELDEVEAAIGVAAGTVVAGNIGSADRYEYTVIGDPVNEAARLTELAKDAPGRLLASDRAVAATSDAAHAATWVLGEPVVLRGRTAPTRPAAPRAAT